MKNRALFRVILAASLSVSICALAAPRVGEPRFVIAEQGFFYVGGKLAETKTGRRLSDQMFVHYQIPEKRLFPYPLVMIHGAATTGVSYEGTPDGREGWAEYFVRRGFAVYVVDQPTYGRSQLHEEVDGPRTYQAMDYGRRQFTEVEKYKEWPQAEMHTQFPGFGAKDNPMLVTADAMTQSNIASNVRMDEINRDAGAALLDRIGPAVVFTHSRSGPYGFLIGDARPGKVKGIVAIEPSGPPFRNPEAGGAAPRNRPWGVAYAKLTYDPAPASPDDMLPVTQDAPLGKDLSGCFPMKGPKRKLVNLTDVPVVVVTGEASFHAQYDHCTVSFLNDVGVKATYMDLAKYGQHGNAHLMMWEKNNLAIAGLIHTWITANVK